MGLHHSLWLGLERGMVHVGQFFYLDTLLNRAFKIYLIRFSIRHFDGLLMSGQPTGFPSLCRGRA